MEIPKIGYVNLFVTKLDASVAFYRDVLYLDQVQAH